MKMTNGRHSGGKEIFSGWFQLKKEDCSSNEIVDDSTNKKITEHTFRQAIIDTGDSGSVAGLKWLARWAGAQFPKWKSFSRVSTNKFRFGDAEAVDSLGQLIIAANIRDVKQNCHPILIRIDIVMQNVPLLLSRRTLVGMDAVLDIGKGELCMHRRINVPIGVSTGGHAILLLQPRNRAFAMERGPMRIYTTQNDRNLSNEWAIEEIQKTHLQLGHASFHKLKGLLSASSKNATDRNIFEVLR